MSQVYVGNGATGGDGGSDVEHLTGNTGGQLNPDVNHNFNIVTANSTAIVAGSGSTLTLDFGLSNLVLGDNLSHLTSGDSNVGLGESVLDQLTSGKSNVAIGLGTLDSLTSSSQNIGIGASALGTLTTGTGQNIGVGHQSLNALTTGLANTAIGSNTAIHLLTGANNIFVGNGSGSNYTSSESDNILIDSPGVVSESHVLRIGVNGSGTNQQNLCYIAGITGATPTSGHTPQVVLCDSTGNLAPISSSTAGYVLTSNGSATPSFQPNVAVSAIETINGDSGSISGTTVTIYANQAAVNSGQSVSFVNSGTTSTFNVTDSNHNTMIGAGAGNLSQVYTEATALGAGAGAALTSGGGSTFIGYNAGHSATTGVNVCVGLNAGQNITTGSENTVIGADAFSGTGPLTGIYNVVVGAGAGNNYLSSESSNILIANPGVLGESNVTRIGIQGSGDQEQNKCFIAGVVGVTSSNPEYVTINSSTGQLGVATFAPVYAYTATAISYQVLITDKIIGVTSNAAARTITMPNSGMVAGQSWTIKDEAGTAQSANNITISGNGANIDGASTFVINTNYGSATVYWNGTNFFVI